MKRFSALLAALFVVFVLLIFGIWFFSHSEGWSLVDSFYFSVMTLTTVGYGDLVPTHDLSKIVTAIYGFVSIPIVLFMFGVIAENYFENRMKGIERRMREIMSQEKEIEEAIEEAEEKIEETEESIENKLAKNK